MSKKYTHDVACIDLEVVEDSEPEREASRQGLRKQTSPARGYACENALQEPDVIELTDGEDRQNKSLSIDRAAMSSALLTSSATGTHSPRNDKERITSVLIDQGDGDAEEGVLDLANFAHMSSNILPKRPFRPTLSHQSSPTGSESDLNPKKTTRAKRQFLMHGISDNHLARLIKCISCDTRWTTRKSATQKMKHIRSCAHKNAFTPETVRIMILKEIATSDTLERKDEDSPSHLTRLDLSTTTLEERVNGMATVKRKRCLLQETVESINVTREAILDSAKEVLERGSMNEEQQKKLRRGGRQNTEVSMPSTQPFGRSALVQHDPHKSSLFSWASEGAGLSCRDNERQNIQVDGDIDIDPNKVRDEPPFSAVSDARKTRKDGRPRSCHDDGTIMPRFTTTPDGCTGAGIEKMHVDHQDTLRDKHIPTDTIDKDWLQNFRCKLMQDRELYLNVLRYEPVHFDVFLRLAEGSGLTSTKLRHSLRIFLDKEAIHYYGVESSGRKRKG
ncbi:hypothetical protein AX17_000895 [Amanita inopinata Kibby_2008]|nr:hypothetical protein AX17_000895 [Amanita inopinata Kibby_2008]